MTMIVIALIRMDLLITRKVLVVCLLSYLLDCKVWRNPYSLFRGAEYQRFYAETGRDPLTFYDMNLSAQDHQTFFTCDADKGKPEYESRLIFKYQTPHSYAGGLEGT